MWEPVSRKKHDVSTELKFALRKSMGDPVNGLLDGQDIHYLQGLHDAGIKDAKKLIDAIKKYGEISLKEDFG